MLARFADRQDPRCDAANPRHPGPGVTQPTPATLFERFRALPAAAPLIAHLDDHDPAQAPPVYAVGGAVRDLLLGGEPFDLDLVVEGDPAQVAAALGGRLRAYDRFGTATVTADGFTYDIARARRESYASPGALPDVVPATLAEDLLRRDFTVNAIALALSGPDAGATTAAPNALEDLEARRLRVLHDASFQDDPTRMLRLARYQSRLGFSIEPGTAALVRPEALETVSGSRIGTELRLLSREPDPVAALRALHELRLDTAIHPGFGLREEDHELAQRALELLPPDGRPDRLALAVAARDLNAETLRRLLDELAFEAEDRDAIIAAATGAEPLARALARVDGSSEPDDRTPAEPDDRPSTGSAIAEAVGGADPELVALAGALGPAREAARWLNEIRRVELEIGGDDLLAAGVPEGPAIGRALKAALAAKRDGRVTGREDELAAALEAVKGTG
jgi:tRNA nucleotidyltransferase (CCA-adding enzyme)